MAKGPGRDTEREQFWRRLINRQAGSGRPIRAWCREHSVREPSFYWWRRELDRRDGERRDPRGREVGWPEPARRGADEAKPAFVPVRLAEDSAPTAEPEIEILLAREPRVRVRGPMNRQRLADVLAVLAERLERDAKRAIASVGEGVRC